MAYIGKQPTVGNFVKLDAITTSATATYNLLNGGVAYSPQSANHCIVSLNGVIQSPNTSFTISGSTIVFASTLTATDVIDFILVLGDVLNIGTPSDATVTNAKLALTAGSAGTPAISIAADTNTGIFFPAADEIALVEGGVEGMRLNSSGNVQFAKNISIGGATPTTSGFGITFPTTASNSSNANTLDDYEEGTWTPGYAPVSGAAFTSITYGFALGAYVKIARQVTCLLRIRTSALTKGAASGDVNLTGLPFTASSQTEQSTFTPVGIGTEWVTSNPSNIRVNLSESTALIQKTFSNDSIQVSNMSTGSANNFIALEFTYFTD